MATRKKARKNDDKSMSMVAGELLRHPVVLAWVAAFGYVVYSTFRQAHWHRPNLDSATLARVGAVPALWLFVSLVVFRTRKEPFGSLLWRLCGGAGTVRIGGRVDPTARRFINRLGETGIAVERLVYNVQREREHQKYRFARNPKQRPSAWTVVDTKREVTIRVNSRVPAKKWDEHLESCAHALGITPGLPARTQTLNGCIELWFARVEPFGNVALYSEAIIPTPTKPTDPVYAAVNELGDLVPVGIVGRHTLVGGITGGGKSSWLNAILCDLARRPEVQFIGIDPKGGLELRPWAPRFAAVAESLTQASQMLDFVWTEYERRLAELGELGKRDWREIVTSERPWLIVVIDELAEVFQVNRSIPEEDRQKDLSNRRDLLIRMSSLVRATGIMLLVATQKPSEELIPTEMRDNLACRIGCRTQTREAARAVMGELDGLILKPHKISINVRGQAVVVDESHGEGLVLRALLVSDEDVAKTVAATRNLRRGIQK